MMILQRLTMLGLMLIFGCVSFYAQGSPTGTITGVTQDDAGAAVAGSRVVATNTGTNAAFEATSDENGLYTIRSLPVGNYNVTVEANGFKTTTLTDIPVRVNEEIKLDATLVVGALSEQVTVSGEPSLVNTTSSTLKTVIDERRIVDLPLNGRDPNALVQLVAGVQPDTRTSLTSGTTYPGAVSVSSNGGRGNTTNYVLDGGSNNDSYNNQSNPTPNPDALQEFSVQTNNFSAEYGRNLGAVVNAVTKSGTNDYHGTLFEYVRNERLNARNFFAPVRNGIRARDGLKRNQFGGVFGGRLPLPHFGEGGPIFDSGKDRTFFFFSYQGTRTRQTPGDTTAIVPTIAQRNGDFSALLSLQTPIILRNPVTGQPYPGNIIPQNQLNPVTQRLLQFIPLANETGNRVRYVVPVKLNDDQTMLRLDHRFSDNNSLFGRIWLSKAAQPAYLDRSNFLASSFGRTWKNTIVALNDTHVFSPKVVNNTVFTFNRTNNVNTQSYPPSLQSLGANLYNDATPQIDLTVNGFFAVNTGDTNNFFRTEYQVANTTRLSYGRHNISVGGEYSHGTNDITNNFRANGVFTFANSTNNPAFTGYGLADFLIGKFTSLTQGGGEYKNTIVNAPAFFIQDDYRVNRKLTLNLGLRWDPFIPYTDENDKLAGYRAGQKSIVYPNAPTGLVYPGDPSLPEGGYEPSLTNFGPRVGFAYDLAGDGKTSIRGGYGIFYDRPNLISTNNAAAQSPFGTVLTTNGNAINSLSNPYAGAVNPFPVNIFPPTNAVFNTSITVFSYAPDLKNGRAQSYNLSIEREIFPSYLVRVAYAGSRSDRLSIVREANAPIFAAGATTNNINDRRPLGPAFGSIVLTESTGSSTYNSMQATLDKRFTQGLSILANYTLSKSIDQSSENKGTGISQTNPNNLNYDRGLANFDHRHRFTAAILYELPRISSQRIVDTFFGGWNVTGIVTLQSGSPFSVLSGVDNSVTGIPNQRADINGDPVLPGDRTRGEQIAQWFNTSVFSSQVRLGNFGSSGRNIIVGPGFKSLNLGLHKNFGITENIKIQLRGEAFNVLNNVNLNPPNNNRSSSDFGRITSAGDPRILQFAARFIF